MKEYDDTKPLPIMAAIILVIATFIVGYCIGNESASISDRSSPVTVQGAAPMGVMPSHNPVS